MKVANVKMSIVLFDHFLLKPLAELCLPIVIILSSPVTVGLPHLPIGADHGVAGAEQLLASKPIAEVERDFLELLGGRFLKQ